MAINYSLLPRSSSPKDDGAPRLVYAAAQSTETVTLEQIAHHIAAHNSPFSAGTIIGLLTDFEQCILEQLKRGARVDLGLLGAFYTTLKGQGARTAEEFTPDMVDHINIRWRPSKEMDKGIQKTKLEFVINRAAQRQLKRQHKEELNREVKENHKANKRTP